MPSYPSRAVRELVEWAAPYGWTYAGLARNGHVILEHPTGGRYQTAATPSEYRGAKNARAELLRRAGAKEAKPNAGRYRKGTGRRQAGYVAGYTPSYDDAPWRTAEAELEDVDGQLSVLDARRYPPKARELAARRLQLTDTLRRYHKPVPPPPVAGL